MEVSNRWKAIATLAGLALLAYIYYPRSHWVIRDRRGDFSVRIPRAWEGDEVARSYWIYTRMAGMLPQAELRVAFAPKPDATDQPDMRLINEALARTRSQSPKFVLEKSETTEVNGLKAYRLTYSFKKMMGGLPVEPHTVHEVMIWRRGKGIYGITLETKYDSLETYKPDYDEVVASFRAPAE